MNTLETSRLLLRPFTWEDRPLVYAIASDRQTTRYLYYWGRQGVTPEADTDRFLRYAVGGWEQNPVHDREYVLIDKATGTAIGDGSIQYVNDTSQEIGWILLPQYRHQGYVHEMAEELLRFGFSMLGCSKITAVCDARNVASHRVMERLHMHTISLTPGARPQKAEDDAPGDELLCGIDKSEWEKLQTNI